ncbi:MAG: manganese efflux pump [Clostridia bacterium]|nr:manganese efflux pump [Clostridia bacterium]
MNLFLILTYAISLSMDAFAVSICKGISIGKPKLKDALVVGAYFGIFQGLMPLIGYFLANSFSDYIEAFDHWIAFVLLLFIGGKMIWECFHPDEDECCCNALSFKTMITMAIATSIDALAVGIAFSCDGMEIASSGLILGVFASCAIICVTTFILSAFGVKIGKLLENKLKKRAEIAGGIVLILLGCKILFEHLSGISIF